MTHFADMIDDASAKLFAPFAAPERLRAAESGAGFSGLWAEIESSGFLDVLSADEDPAIAGEGAFRVIRNSGRALLPAPLGETIVARAILAQAHLTAPSGALTFGQDRAPYGRHAAASVSISNGAVALAHVASVLRQDFNAAGEPRDTLRLETHVESVRSDWTPDRARAAMALVRASQIAGALERVLVLTVDYARTRKQFGKPIGQFQAIQQQLAVLAAQTSSAGVAAAHAFRRWAHQDFVMLAAAAKIRAGEAAGSAISIAHQTHGAIGITFEHELHFATRRLHSWRAEFGAESDWAMRLGAWAANLGPANLWDRLTKS